MEFQGPQGSPGATGPQGALGDYGPQGFQGSQGNLGSRGPQGLRGVTGVQGHVGHDGRPGDQGIQGLTGAQGVTGTPGLKGEIGPQGKNGNPGLQGEKGEKGDRGLVGSQGPVGNTGSTGSKGQQGSVGPQGIHGAIGIVTSRFNYPYAASKTSSKLLLEAPMGGPIIQELFNQNLEIQSLVRFNGDESQEFVSALILGCEMTPKNTVLMAKHVGLINNTTKFYATNGNGSAQTLTEISTGVTTSDAVNVVRIIIHDGLDVKFYVNGKLKATHRKNVPSGALLGHFGSISMQSKAEREICVGAVNVLWDI